MGDFNSAGLPTKLPSVEEANRLLGQHVQEAFSIAKMLQWAETNRRLYRARIQAE